VAQIDQKELVALIIEEMDCKKVFQAKWVFDCALCGDHVDEGTDFVFIGDKQKICVSCQAYISEFFSDALQREEEKDGCLK